MRIKKSSLLCGIVIFLQLLWMQKKVFWPSLSGSMYQIVYYMKYIATFALLFYSLSKPRGKELVRKRNKYFNLFIPLFMLFFIVEIVAIFNSPAVSTYGVSYWTRCLALLLDKVCILTMVSSVWMLCGEKSIDCVSTTLILIGFLQMIVVLLRTGVLTTLQVFGIVFGFSSSNAASALLETNEYTFVLGLLLIYYIFFRKKDDRKVYFRIISLAILLIAGGKRIVFGGIIVAGLFSFFVKKRGLRKGTLTAVGLMGTIISVFYVAMCYNGEAMAWLALHNVDVMGRDVIYSYFTERTSFSFDFMGWGLAGISKFIENLTRSDVGNMASVRGLHNDILKIYIELGFVGGVLWYLYNLVYLPRKLFHNFGKKDATLYIALILYAFITYLTDNTENYFIFQVVLWLIPLTANPDNSYDLLELSEELEPTDYTRRMEDL